MRLDALDRGGKSAGLLHGLDARLKLIGALVLVVIAVAAPIGSWNWFGIEGFALALLIGLSGIPPRDLARRYFTFLVLVGFLALLVSFTHPARAQHGLGVVFVSILIKNSLAIVAMLLLAGVTSFQAILAALRKIGLPAVLVATLGFMERYRYVLADELDRMATARRARTFKRQRTFSLSLAGGLIGLLFLRAFERAERVHGAMVARGWQGTLRGLDEERGSEALKQPRS
jgi:cobalt/nickel transport system permease protein